jgi:hypothetical protein
MSPESIKSKQYSYHSDCFSFGVLLFELTHRVMPYKGMEPYNIAKVCHAIVITTLIYPILCLGSC